MLEKRVTSKDADIPGKFNLSCFICFDSHPFFFLEFLHKKPQCMYGKECHTQSTISHIKKYQHWLKENVSGDTKFSIKQVGLSESDMETEEEAENTGDETEEDTDNESQNGTVNDSDDYMETDEE